jgi:AbiJ N-terminal domain 3
MNRISEITKRDIFDLFRSGMDMEEIYGTEKVTYHYFGQMDELEFLRRLYDLESMPSFDYRFPNAEGDIWQHTINNDDYPYCWVFKDERFHLKDGKDEVYLRFICEIFHPAVRFERGHWMDFLNKINILLQNDGYELYPAEKISNRDVYSWRLYQADNGMFVPFSQRNKKLIKQKEIVLKINREARNQIYKILEKYDYRIRKISDTGWEYDVLVSDEILQDIKMFYTPKCFNENNKYVETDSLKDFVLSTLPYNVIDAIEFFEKYCKSDLVADINTIFSLNGISLKLINGKIESMVTSHITNSSLASIGEVGLKELLQEASRYYEKENLSIAVEKLWDAFERLKTYYSPTLDKKKSVNKITENMSGNIEPFKELFEKEFHELTRIGNNFRIRHHETTKVDIEDIRHYDYFYKRCLSLVTTAIRYLDNREVM